MRKRESVSRRRGARMVALLSVLLLLASVAVAVAGCGDAESSATTTVGDAAAAPAPAGKSTGEGAAMSAIGPAAGSSLAPVDTVTVGGTGKVSVAPDEAVLRVGVVTTDADAAKAVDLNAKAMDKVIAALKAQGLDDKAIQTTNVTVYPEYEVEPTTGQQKPVRYRAQNTVQVTLKDVSAVGKVFAAAAEAGANDVSGPEWRLSDDSKAVQDALAKAVANARVKAETLATAAGVKVGQVLSVAESGVTQPPVVYEQRDALAMKAAEGVATPAVNPQDLEVSAAVTVSYRLDR